MELITQGEQNIEVRGYEQNHIFLKHLYLVRDHVDSIKIYISSNEEDVSMLRYMHSFFQYVELYQEDTVIFSAFGKEFELYAGIDYYVLLKRSNSEDIL